MKALVSGCLLAVIVGGCSADTPAPTDLGRADGGDAGDASTGCPVSWALADVSGDDPACKPKSGDFAPGEAGDGYPACVSDDGAYHRIEASIGSLGRVAGFEKIAGLLLRDDGQPPDRQAFLDARLTYTEAEGLDSRVSRREDEHYAAAAQRCADMNPAEIAAHADRCVGQARIQPLLNQALADGSAGLDPLLNAARVEAGLLWFLYVSVHKEATTCTDARKDCDSSYAYYTGGEEGVGAGLGLARYVRSVSPRAHGAAWNGLLAVRCWRDLDQAVPAADLALRDRAIGQLDRALLRGLALVVKSRLTAFEAISSGCDEARAALWLGVQVLGGVLDREATARDAARAATLREELARSADAAAPADVSAALEALFPCPW